MMKTAINIELTRRINIKYELQPGSRSLKHYKFYVPGLSELKSKEKVIEALNLGFDVFCIDRILNTAEKWNGKEWEKCKQVEYSQNIFSNEKTTNSF